MLDRFYIYCHGVLKEEIHESYNRKANLSALASCIDMLNKYNNDKIINVMIKILNMKLK